ncbi:MmgE/PrpD family protein [Elioraea rosea]|uniref:MmgE/PrpD family protein n=1 Tax=Elioraea rosea TaxID=2492390 RepID=UPI001181D466|nr:MmgE/PrpD family protein [Elioraea rosea]
MPHGAVAWAFDGPAEGGREDKAARLLLLDSLGCALAGLRHARPHGFGEALAHAMPGRIALPGVAASLSRAGAAGVLAASMCWDEANDGLAIAHGRPGLAVAPLVLAALAEGVTLGEARAAYALGYEVAARAGLAWRIRPGMHVDGSWHALGAAAAAARLAGGGAASAARAVRLAACQIPASLYAPIAAGMDGRNTYPAHAVLLGTLAAAASAAGMDAPKEGFAAGRKAVLGRDDAPATAEPGRWLLAEAYIKPYAGVRHAHYAAAAAIALRGRIPADSVSAILLETYGEALTYAGNRAPASAIKAQFSLSWAAAAALAQGDLSPEAYTDAALADPALRRLEALVELRDWGGGREGRGARLTIVSKDGRRETAAVEAVPGDAALPMTREAVVAKFARFAGPTLEARTDAVAGVMLDGAAGARLDPFSRA